MWRICRYVAPVCLACLIFAAQPAEAGDREAAADMVTTLANCAVYYSLVGRWLKNRAESTSQKLVQEQAEEGLARANKAGILGISAANKIARIIGMKKETVDATMHIATKHMLDRIGGDVVNLDILNNEYGDLCKAEFERSTEWMNQHAPGPK